jgi:hypothetical protein
MKAWRALGWALMAAGSAGAQVTRDDVPMDEYLLVLERIAPAAREAAQAYLRAYQENCGHPMQTVQLRQAVAEGSGEPVLMAMIRAAHYQDQDALRSLRARVPCGGRP